MNGAELIVEATAPSWRPWRRWQPCLHVERLAYALELLTEDVTLRPEPGCAAWSGGGYYWHDSGGHIIVFDPELSPRAISRTLHHEICHAMQFEAGLPLQERAAQEAEDEDYYPGGRLVVMAKC